MTGGPACCRRSVHHPLFGTGRAVFVLLLEEPGRRHPRMSHNFESGRISQRFRTYWRPTPTRWTLQNDKNIITVQGHHAWRRVGSMPLTWANTNLTVQGVRSPILVLWSVRCEQCRYPHRVSELVDSWPKVFHMAGQVPSAFEIDQAA